MTNDAAERLRAFLQTHNINTVYLEYLDQALAAERRAYFDELMVAGLIGPKGLTFDAAKQAADAMEERVVAVTHRATVERIRERVELLVSGGRPMSKDIVFDERTFHEFIRKERVEWITRKRVRAAMNAVPNLGVEAYEPTITQLRDALRAEAER